MILYTRCNLIKSLLLLKDSSVSLCTSRFAQRIIPAQLGFEDAQGAEHSVFHFTMIRSFASIQAIAVIPIAASTPLKLTPRQTRTY